MKSTLLFFTFLGIYTSQAQRQPENQDSVIEQKIKIDKVDSLTKTVNPSVKLFPNPAKNKVEIEIKDFRPGFVQVRLIDNNGKLVKDYKRMVFTGNEIIVLMFSEKPGLYFVVLKQDEHILKTKLLIQ